MNKDLLSGIGFDNLYDKVLEKVLPTFSDTSTHIDIYIDNESKFIEIVEKMTGLKVSFARNRSNHNYPPLNSSSVKVTEGDLSTLIGTGTDIMRRPHSIASLLKAKAEFLERLSSSLPLDIAKGVEFDIAKTLDIVKAKKLKIKSLINGDTLYKNYEDIYYFLNRNIKNTNLDIGNTNDLNVNIENKKNLQMTTNGCAGHFDYDKAVCAGWLEYIQRDGFLMHWLNSISPKVIDVDTHYLNIVDTKNNIYNANIGAVYTANNNSISSQDISKILLNLKKYNLEYYFLDITSDIAVSNVLCVIVVEVNGIKRLQMGAGTGFDADKAIFSSAIEALAGCSFRHGRQGSHENIVQSIKDNKYIPFTDKNINQNVRQDMYYHKDMIKYIDFIYKSKETITVEDWAGVSAIRGFDIKRLSSDTKYQLEYLKHIFKEKIEAGNDDYNVYVYEYKNKLIKYFDFKAVRVICPALYSLYLNESFADPNHPRLAEFIKNKGLENKAKINIWPHPFP